MKNTKKYFQCDKYRAIIDRKYVEKYIKNNKVVFYDTYEKANKNFGFVDDSDYEIMSIDENVKIEFANGRKLI